MWPRCASLIHLLENTRTNFPFNPSLIYLSFCVEEVRRTATQETRSHSRSTHPRSIPSWSSLIAVTEPWVPHSVRNALDMKGQAVPVLNPLSIRTRRRMGGNGGTAPHLFTSGLDGDEWLDSLSNRLYPWKRVPPRFPLDKRLKAKFRNLSSLANYTDRQSDSRLSAMYSAVFSIFYTRAATFTSK
jgi:hypothetical protein